MRCLADMRHDGERPGWRTKWLHPTTTDRFLGSWWADRSDAEHIAEALRRGGCREVRIVRGLGREDEI